MGRRIRITWPQCGSGWRRSPPERACCRIRSHPRWSRPAAPAWILTSRHPRRDLQAPRVAVARGVPLSRVRDLVRAHTEPPTFGFLGHSRVNVLELNLALD